MKIGKNICNSNIVEAKSFHIALLCDCFCERLNPRLLAPSPKLRAELCHEIYPPAEVRFSLSCRAPGRSAARKLCSISICQPAN